jgi:hypothetical protein
MLYIINSCHFPNVPEFVLFWANTEWDIFLGIFQEPSTFWPLNWWRPQRNLISHNFKSGTTFILKYELTLRNYRDKFYNNTSQALLCAHQNVYLIIYFKNCLNPILHTAWLDNHALTLKRNSAKYYIHEKSRFLHTFLKFFGESRKI